MTIKQLSHNNTYKVEEKKLLAFNGSDFITFLSSYKSKTKSYHHYFSSTTNTWNSYYSNASNTDLGQALAYFLVFEDSFYITKDKVQVKSLRDNFKKRIDLLENSKKVVDELLKDNYKTVYVSKESILPRHKLRKFIKDKNLKLKITYDANKADLYINSGDPFILTDLLQLKQEDPKVKKPLFSSSSYNNTNKLDLRFQNDFTLVKREEMINILENILKDVENHRTIHMSPKSPFNNNFFSTTSTYIIEPLKTYIKVLKENTEDYVVIYNGNMDKSVFNSHFTNTDYTVLPYNKEFLDTYEHIYNKCAIIKDSDFSSLLGENIIDLEMYKTLCSFLESPDKNNVDLALTIISNSNFQKSAVYLFDLVNVRYRYMFEKNINKHVNLKELLYYFEYNSHNGLNNTKDKLKVASSIIKFLNKKGVYNSETMAQVKEYIEQGLIEMLENLETSYATKLNFGSFTVADTETYCFFRDNESKLFIKADPKQFETLLNSLKITEHA